MRVTGLPIDPGPAAWNALLPSISSRPSLQGAVTADWVVVGAGFAGISAARRLAELHPGDRIMVLEAGMVAEGASGRNSGFMIDVPHDLTSSDYGGGIATKEHRDIRLNRAGIAYALQARDEFGMPVEAINQTGKINGAITRRGIRHNDSYAQHLGKLGEPFERLSAADMRRITGSPAYSDGLYSPGTVMLQPALYSRLLAQGIESDRLTIYENSPVVEFERSGTRWRVSTPAGTVTTPKVILTVNGHLECFGYLPRRLMHIYTFASMTRKLNSHETALLGGEPRWAITPADSLGTTVRRISGTGGDRLVIRNRAVFAPTLVVNEQRLESIYRSQQQSFDLRFPMLPGVEMEYRWGGRLCLSLNNVPAFGEIENGLFTACCQNGLGTAKGTISGKLIAELASDESSELLADQLADAQPQRLPPAPIARLAADIRLGWGEFMAGQEL